MKKARLQIDWDTAHAKKMAKCLLFRNVAAIASAFFFPHCLRTVYVRRISLNIYGDYFNITSRHEVCEERKVSFERADRMRVELESMDFRLEEERKRSADLLQQVTLAFTLSCYASSSQFFIHFFFQFNIT